MQGISKQERQFIKAAEKAGFPGSMKGRVSRSEDRRKGEVFTIQAAERQGIEAARKAEYPGRMAGGHERYSLFRQQKGRVFRQ